MPEIGHSIAFRLRGTKSNRDAIGAAITVESGTLRQTKYVQAGSGFLAQHSKQVFFGVGEEAGPVQATIHWPSGLSQELAALPVNHRIEVEEGSADFIAKPFPEPPQPMREAWPPPAHRALPARIATWLIQPLQAPEFSLPDLDKCTAAAQGLPRQLACCSLSGPSQRRFPPSSSSFCIATAQRSQQAR